MSNTAPGTQHDGLATTATGPGSAADIPARIERVPVGRFHFRLASIVGTGTFFDGFDAISVAVVLPAIVAAFGISFAEAGLIISAGYLGQFIGALVIGALSDRFGRKKAFIISLTLFGLLSLACAFAWSSTSLMVFRLIQGLGLGAEVPVAGTLISEYLGRKSRGKFAVVYQSLFTWGLFFAPLVALLLTTTMGPEIAWRVLLGIGVLPLIVAVWAVFALPESARWLAGKGRLPEAEALVSQLEREATAHGHTLAPLEPTTTPDTSHRFRMSEIFRGQYGRRTILLAILWFTTFFVTYGFSVWLPTMYVAIGGLPQQNSLILTVILGAIQIAMAYVVASFVDRLGRKPTFIIGFAVATLGGLFGVVNIVLLGNTSWPILFVTGIILTIGIMLPTVTLYLYTAELYPTRMRGFATSSASSLSRVASIVSPFVFGFLLDGHGGAGAIFAILAGMAVVGLIAMSIGGIETRNRRLEEISR
ncbi:MFS transporter [Herbiconiux sp. P16]|uniref:MFS transporter n=1 Tax=Herbiconiux wuyangfengii TaxID=3342794 RepID=UPI0035B721C5